MKGFWGAKIIMAGVMAAAPAMAAAPNVSPSPYRVDGKPVPSSCLSQIETGEAHIGSTVELGHCGTPGLKIRATPDGMIGYDDPAGGYFQYRFVGRIGDLDILYEENSGGGSGEFSGLDGVKRDGNKLRLARMIASGDRCNGGISNVRLSNGQLTFDQQITPYDLVAMADPKVKVEAYKDLEDSAASCIGTSHMTGDDKHWAGVSLTQPDWPDEKGWTEDYRHQACFNKLYRELEAADHVDLDHRGVTEFAQAFVKRCVKS